MIISQIVAVAKNNVIGKANDIPWRIPGEQKRFKALTMDKTVIMGRKTYESICSDLKGRNIIVISSTMEEGLEGKSYKVFETVPMALEHCQGQPEVFIVGGGQIYRETIHMSHKLYITELDHEIEGDIYYPAFDRAYYDVTYEEYVPKASIPYTYYTYERK